MRESRLTPSTLIFIVMISARITPLNPSPYNPVFITFSGLFKKGKIMVNTIISPNGKYRVVKAVFRTGLNPSSNTGCKLEICILPEILISMKPLMPSKAIIIKINSPVRARTSIPFLIVYTTTMIISAFIINNGLSGKKTVIKSSPKSLRTLAEI